VNKEGSPLPVSSIISAVVEASATGVVAEAMPVRVRVAARNFMRFAFVLDAWRWRMRGS
jgi:hypothetical protein